jgi:hypothetical protein
VLMRLPYVRSIIPKRGELFRHFQLRHNGGLGVEQFSPPRTTLHG